MITGGSVARRRAFTLADLAAIVGVVVLVVPLGLSGLGHGDEQARIAQCLSNMRGLMAATQSYLADYDGCFPVIVKSGDGTIGLCGWSYGGKAADDYWRAYGGGLFYLPATKRPLNEYLLGARVEPDSVGSGGAVERTEVLMLQCPSDRTSYQRVWPSSTPLSVSSYNDVGTSYQFNYEALMDTNIDPWTGAGSGWSTLGRHLVRDAAAAQPESFVFYFGEPMDYGVHQQIGVVGQHGEMFRHTAAFLDGHAAYMHMDTRRYCGPGWQAINTAWVRRMGQPKPPIFYVDPHKNCDPL